MAFNDTISTLSGSSTFYDWFIKENNEIISKLNLVTVSGITSGDGVLATTNLSTGVATVSIGGTSGNILTGLTFSGNVSFLGEAVVPNISYKITGITSGTNGYTFGSVVRLTSSGYTTAQANNADAAEVVGVISARNSAYSVVTLSGRIQGDFTNVAGGTLSPGCVYFLDPTTAGNITTTEPTTVGQVSKPVIVGLGQTAGMVIQYRGNYLNASAVGGESGTNRLYISFPTSGSTDPRAYGFSAGTFLSYAPDLISGNTFFNQYIADTGRTAIGGWFLSGSKNYAYRTYESGSPFLTIPQEEDFIVGMVETVTTIGSDALYQIIARGTTPIIPGSISNAGSKSGAWFISGVTFNPLGITGQLQKYPTDPASNPYVPSYQAGFVFSASPTSWYVNPRPLTKQITTSNYRVLQQPQTLTATNNYAFNGDFSIWQRSNIGKESSYTVTSSTYFADNWILRTSGITNGSSYVQRESFSPSQTDVEGSPEYYIRFKAITDPAGAAPTNCVYSVGHVIPNSETFHSESITISFYAKAAQPNYSANVYFAKYGDGGVITKTVIGTINLQTTWTKHTLNYTVESYSGTYSNDYVEVGVDLNPLVNDAFDTSISTATNLYVDLASFVVYSGTYVDPPHNFQSDQEKIRFAQKYYFSTYKDSQVIGTRTVSSEIPIQPTLNAFSFTHLPNSPWGIMPLPSRMRTAPSVTVYSPYNATSPELFNYTAQNDLRNTGGSKGYQSQVRYPPYPIGTPTVTTTVDETNIRINLIGGSVPYDVIYGHIVADASYPI